MRLVQNFHEAPGPDAMAKSVLDAVAREDYRAAVPLACHAAHNCGRAAFFELNALCATTLTKAGNPEHALEYWDKIIRSAPHKLTYLEAAIATAWRSSNDKAHKQLAEWMNLLERVFIKAPDARFLSILTARGWQGEGSVGISEGRVKGWVWSEATPRLIVECEKKVDINMRLVPHEQIGKRTLYRLDAALPETSSSLKINLLANGHIQGSPVIVSSAKSIRAKKVAPESQVTIIIPVYDDYQATLRCIGTVLASLRSNKQTARVLAAWDCGPDARLLAKLRKLARRMKLELVENPHNMGFLGTVNAALALSDGDVILLNADTLVHGDWIDRLVNAASAPNAATVTALGNEAELMSFPGFSDRAKISSLRQVKLLDEAARKLDSGRALLELPVGVGFCMYITRKAINKIGGLDGRFLFRGYGEEVEYCLRASEAGLKNYGAFNVFVGHLGEKSFGIGKKALAAQNNEAIFKKFPAYRRDYDIFLAGARPRELREEISRNVLLANGFCGELELRPWSARYLPPWIRDANHQTLKKGGVLFLQPGKNPRAILRVWQNIPFPDIHFDLRESADELNLLLGGMGITKAISRRNTESLRKLGRSLGLDILEDEEKYALPKIAMPLPEAILAAPPPSVADWKTLKRAAQENPFTSIYVFQLGVAWGNAPRPANLHELPLLDNYQPLGIEACLLWDGRDLVGWREWLASHGCAEIPFCRLEVNV